MANEPEDIDLDQIVWDPRYRRSVIEWLNRLAHEPLPPMNETSLPVAPEPTPRAG